MNRKITITLNKAPLPANITAAIQEAGADNYIICLNSEQTADKQAAGFLHECLHIYHDDFTSLESADQIEQTRHAELLRLLEQEAQQL